MPDPEQVIPTVYVPLGCVDATALVAGILIGHG